MLQMDQRMISQESLGLAEFITAKLKFSWSGSTMNHSMLHQTEGRKNSIIYVHIIDDGFNLWSTYSFVSTLGETVFCPSTLQRLCLDLSTCRTTVRATCWNSGWLILVATLTFYTSFDRPPATHQAATTTIHHSSPHPPLLCASSLRSQYAISPWLMEYPYIGLIYTCE